MNSDFNQKAAKFIINEVLPRAKKKDCSIEEILPHCITHKLINFELEGITFRAQTREFLDHYFYEKNSHSDNSKFVLYLIADSLREFIDEHRIKELMNEQDNPSH